MIWSGFLNGGKTKAAARGCAIQSPGPELDADPAAADPKSSFWRDTLFLWAMALFSLFLHFATASRYDLFIDEIYVLAASKHALVGSIDVFPLSFWLDKLSLAVLGSSLFALRFLPAVAGAANILVAGLLARELGGRRFAVSVAGLSVLVAPLLMFAAGSADLWAYEGILWSLSALLVVRILRTGNGRLWWLVGIVWGLGLLNKPTVLLFMLGVGLGLLLTRARGELLRKGYWLALVVALVVFSPALIWQTVHGWPFLGAMAAMRGDEFSDSVFWIGYFSRSKMLLAQPAFLGPLTFVLAVLGVFHAIVSGKEDPHRSVLWACVAVVLAFVATSGFTYYMNPMYSILLAFGSAVAARITERRNMRWMRPALVFGLVAQGLVVAPLCVSVLPKESLGTYSRYVCRGILAPLSSTATILQGLDSNKVWAPWLNRAYAALPASEQKSCCIIVGYAPFAAAAEFYGTQYHFPEIFSPHLNYMFWGPPAEGTEPVIALFFNRKELEGWFGRVEYVGNPGDNPNCPVYLCRLPKCTYRAMWKNMCEKDSSFRWRVDREEGQS